MLKTTLSALLVCAWVLSPAATWAEPKRPAFTQPTPPDNAANPRLVRDIPPDRAQPKSFRTSAQLAEASHQPPGLSELRCSGSAVFNEKELRLMKESFSSPAIVVDLRQESHGYLNGNPVTWMATNDWVNLGKTPEQASRSERESLQRLAALKQVKVATSKDLDDDSAEAFVEEPVSSVSSEGELVGRLGLGYRRFYVTDHMRPDDRQVDEFVQFVDTLPAQTWLHFHCRGGKGRTTTFMAMYDMLRNAHRVSCDEILQRQAAAGPGYTLIDTRPGTAKHLFFQERLAFLKRLHEFARERHKGERISWSAWLRQP